MGCDIHMHVERKTDDGWEEVICDLPFDWRSYSMFAFLAGVRNYSDIPPISAQRGLPDDASAAVRSDLGDDTDLHSISWLGVTELATFNYDTPVEDRRVTRQIGHNCWSGAITAEPGGGKMTTFRALLGEKFFTGLENLKLVGADRVVFGFDNWPPQPPRQGRMREMARGRNEQA